MSDFKYTNVYGKLEDLLEKIRTTGVPPKANKSWLDTLGYTSSNDRSMTSILKALGFIDQSNVPQDRWRAYRGANHRQVLGEAIRETYADLFNLYPDACDRSDNELENFFRTRTDAGDQVVRKITSTFKALCSNADLGGKVSLNADPPETAKPDQKKKSGDSPPRRQDTGALAESFGPTVHIDIQIHISPESSAEQVDQIFKSMAKHLYKTPES